MLAEFLQLCEATGRWPEKLSTAHVVLLCKGELPVAGLQARPITLLPLIYRAWAKVRAKQLKAWLEGHTECMVGCRQEAEYQAALLATTLGLGSPWGRGRCGVLGLFEGLRLAGA